MQKCCNSVACLAVVYERGVLHLYENYELYVRSKEKTLKGFQFSEANLRVMSPGISEFGPIDKYIHHSLRQAANDRQGIVCGQKCGFPYFYCI